jgi:hypothetical protein
MSQASVVVARSPPSIHLDFTAQQQKDTLSQFLQVTPLLLYVIRKSTNTTNFKTQTFCLYGEPYYVSSDFCEVKGGRFGVEVNEDFDKDIAFVIGYVGSKNGIELFNSNLSCVAKTGDFSSPSSSISPSYPESYGCSGSWGSSGSCSGKKVLLEKKSSKDSVSMQVERKKKGFLEVSDLVVRISWDTIAKILYPAD